MEEYNLPDLSGLKSQSIEKVNDLRAEYEDFLSERGQEVAGSPKYTFDKIFERIEDLEKYSRINIDEYAEKYGRGFFAGMAATHFEKASYLSGEEFINEMVKAMSWMCSSIIVEQKKRG